jgi:hypothetical protein
MTDGQDDNWMDSWLDQFVEEHGLAKVSKVLGNYQSTSNGPQDALPKKKIPTNDKPASQIAEALLSSSSAPEKQDLE